MAEESTPTGPHQAQAYLEALGSGYDPHLATLELLDTLWAELLDAGHHDAAVAARQLRERLEDWEPDVEARMRAAADQDRDPDVRFALRVARGLAYWIQRDAADRPYDLYTNVATIPQALAMLDFSGLERWQDEVQVLGDEEAIEHDDAWGEE